MIGSGKTSNMFKMGHLARSKNIIQGFKSFKRGYDGGKNEPMVKTSLWGKKMHFASFMMTSQPLPSRPREPSPF
jgi:hypothetical protein